MLIEPVSNYHHRSVSVIFFPPHSSYVHMILSFSLQDSATTESMVAMGYMLSKILEDVSAKEASEAVAIELTNGFEVDLPNKSGRALYPETSYLNHSCVPNIAQSHKVIQNGPSTTAITTGDRDSI